MKKTSKKFTVYIYIELIIYIVLGLFFLFLPFWREITLDLKNFLFTLSLSLVIVYHFFICNVFPQLNTIHSDRILKSKYAPGSKEDKLDEIDRKGDVWIIRIFLLFLFCIFTGCQYKVIQWNMILAGMYFLLAFNNFFKYHTCLIKLLVYREKINCCMDCHICGWDNILIFSLLPFSFLILEINIINKLLIIIVCILSLAGLVVWEYFLYFHPERMMPKGNTYLQCSNCQKKCVNSKGMMFYSTENCVNNSASKGNFKKVFQKHYAAFGLIFSSLLFGIESLLLGIDYMIKYIIFFFVLIFGMSSWQIIYIYIRNCYKELFYHHIDKVVVWEEHKNKSGDEIRDEQYHEFDEGMFNILTLRNILIYTFSLSILTFFGALLLYQDNLFDLPQYVDLNGDFFLLSNLRFSVALFFFLICLQIGCKAFVIFYNSYKQLQYISTLKTKSEYFINGYIHFNAIKNFCSKSIVIIASICLSLIIAIIFSPINDESDWKILIVCILSVISFCPTVIFFGVQRYLKIIQNKMKKNTLETFENNYILQILNEKNVSIKDFKERMNYRNELYSKNINTSLDRNIISFLVTISAAIIQFILIFSNGN